MVSVDWESQTTLDAAHEERRASADLASLFRAHGSPAFYRLVESAMGLDRPESQSSLDSCEKVSRHPPNQAPSGENLAREPAINVVSDATEALRAGLARSRARQRRIIEMIGVGEVAHAKRYATCQRKSSQLECTLCGSKDNYVPITCDSRLCETCMNRAMGKKNGKYGDVVEAMESGTFGTFTMRNVGEIERGVEAIRGAFGRLRQRTIPSSGSVTRETEDGELVTQRWVWKQADDGGEPADYYWKSALCAAGKQELARALQKRYVDQGKQIPWSELVKGGLYGIDIKEQEEGRYHIHLHTLMDSAFIPQAALSSVWEDLTGAPVVDLRRGDRGALQDVVGYVCKPPAFETLEAEIEYLTTVKGSPLVQPFGDLHGNTPDLGGLLRCAHCDDVPRWWEYLGIVDGCYDTMTPDWEETGDRPPP